MLVNGTADNVDFTLSGITPGVAAKTLDSIPPVRGAAVQLGLMTLDDYYQPMGSIVPIGVARIRSRPGFRERRYERDPHALGRSRKCDAFARGAEPMVRRPTEGVFAN